MQVFAGTSGFSFDEWRGYFYPAGLAAEARLAHYALRLRGVEINNTFYQMPKREQLERWRDTVPENFRFALKAPRRLTHSRPLRSEGDVLDHFLETALALGTRLGPILFQLPPFARKDTPLLADFLARLPSSIQAAFEFRNRSWFDDDTFALLASRNAALCGGDSDERGDSPPQVVTADFGYLRLRAPSYDAESLRDWSRRILAEPWKNAYVFLKHEVLGPDYACFIAAVVSGAPDPPLIRSEVDHPIARDQQESKRRQTGGARRQLRRGEDEAQRVPGASPAHRREVAR